MSIKIILLFFKGSATSQLLMISDQPSMTEEEVSAIISTSSSMTSDGGSATSRYVQDLQSRDNQGWKTVDLYDKEDPNGRYIRSNLDLDTQGYMGELLVESDKSTVTKAVLFKDTESVYSFDSAISKGEVEQFGDRNEESLLTEIYQLREQRDSKEVKENSGHEEKEGNGRKLNSEVQLGNYEELDRDGLMTWYLW